jgi:hypothetical protein
MFLSCPGIYVLYYKKSLFLNTSVYSQISFKKTFPQRYINGKGFLSVDSFYKKNRGASSDKESSERTRGNKFFLDKTYPTLEQSQKDLNLSMANMTTAHDCIFFCWGKSSANLIILLHNKQFKQAP